MKDTQTAIALAIFILTSFRGDVLTQSPPPAISSVSPNRIAVGSPPTDIIIRGTGFVSGVGVRLGASTGEVDYLITVLISDTELRATVPGMKLLKPELFALSIVTPSTQSESVRLSVYSMLPPSIASISPAAAARGATFALNAIGSNLIGIELVFDSAGFEVASVSGSDSTLSFQVRVAASVPLGTRLFSFSKPIGETSTCPSSPCSIRIVDGGSWQPSEIPRVPDRSGASLTVLLDGRVLVAGGGGGGDSAVAGIFDPGSGSWTDVSPMNLPRNGHRGVLLPDGRVVVLTGRTAGPFISTVEIYDPVAKAWVNGGFIRNTFVYPVLLPNGKVLLVPDEIYDPATMSSTRVNGPGESLGSSTNSDDLGAWGGTLLPDGTVFVTGRRSRATGGLTAAIYDPRSDTARSLPSGTQFVESGTRSQVILPNGDVLIGMTHITFTGRRQTLFLFDSNAVRWNDPPPINFVSTLAVLPTGKALLYGSSQFRSTPPSYHAVTFDPSTRVMDPAIPTTLDYSPQSAILDDGRLLTVPAVYTPEATRYPAPLVNRISVFDRRSTGDLTLAIDGSNFLPNSQVRFGETRLTKLYVGSGRIFSFVPAQVYSANPSSPVTVSNSGPGGGTSAPLTVGAVIFPPSLTGLNPATVMTGSSVTLTLTGSNLDTTSSVAVSGSGVTAQVLSGATSTSASVLLTVSPDALPGVRSITVTAAGGTATLSPAITIQRPRPASPSTAPQRLPEVEEGPINTGYIVVTPESFIAPSAVLTYGIVSNAIVQSQAGLIPTALATEATLFCDIVPAIQRRLGIAVANSSTSAATVTFTLSDQEGSSVATRQIALGGYQQIARFVDEWFSGDVIGAAFRGSIRIQSTVPVSIAGLRFSGAEFSATPVMISRSAPSVAGAVFFPQFALGGGWASVLALVNNTGTTLTGRVDFFDGSGTPLALKLNGVLRSTFTYSLAPGGTTVLAPTDSNGQSPF
ncbi:MAG: IPT/TIG domain-containing protein [Acidobacteria bacterium]|nr:IPT/TIG domain-containing protein [Acidobacteriota bacterium]